MPRPRIAEVRIAGALAKGSATRRPPAIPGAALLALVSLLAVAALTACGGNSSGGGGTGPEAAPKAGPEAPVTLAAQGKPKRGGTIRYALEADADGFSPTKSRWSIVGMDMGMAIFDPMVGVDTNGNPHPYLAEKYEASADNKVWTFTMRKGIKFHNNEPLNADAVTNTYRAHKESGLTGFAITNVASVESVGDLQVRFTMKEPWATFPIVLTGQLGVIPAPAQLLMDNAGPQTPIGTGPFTLTSRTIDKETVVARNPDYWQRDKDGVQLPYLDGVSFQPNPDDTQRINGLQSGQFQLVHTSNGPGVLKLRELASAGTIQKVEDLGESEEGFVLLNLAKAPFDDIRVRKALAMSIDRQDYINGPGQGVNKPADNVFEPSSAWYVPVDYPKYDPSAAKALVDEYKREKGPITFTLRAGGVDSRNNIEYLQQKWNAIGMEVKVDMLEQGRFIITSINGDFDANFWRQWGEVDPDQDYLWWIGQNAAPIGQIALNFARNKDPIVDAALNKGRSTTNLEERRKAYAEVQKEFAAKVTYIWLDHSTWVIGAANNVRGITNGPLPDGADAMPIGGTTFPGTHRLTQTWLAS